MLSFLRKKKVAKKILIALAALIIPAFVLWGVGSLGDKTIAGKDYVGTVGNHKVKFDEFFDAKRGAHIQFILSYLGQKELLEKILNDRELMNKIAWDRIIMLEEARKRGIKVSDKEVVGFITSHPLFVTDGYFDQKFYEYVLRQNLGISARTFEEEVRSALEISKLKNEILKNVTITDEEALSAYRKDFEKGKISYILIDVQKFNGQAEVKTEDIEGYYNGHKKEFTKSKQLNLEYMGFSYMSPEERQALVRIVNPLHKNLAKNPQDFEKVAEENSKEIEETGRFAKEAPPVDMQINSAAFDRLFTKEAGAVGIILTESASGFIYLVRIKEKIEQELQPIEEVSPAIEKQLKDSMEHEMAAKRSREIYELITEKNLSLEDAAKEAGVDVKKTEFISRFDYVDGVGGAYEMLDEVFMGRSDKAQGPYSTRKGYAIVRLEDFQEIDTEKFEKDKDTYRNKVLDAKKNQALTDWFSEVSQESELVIDLSHL